mgnify:FL=1
MNFKDISVQDFKKNFKGLELLVDIRDEDSFNKGNIPNSVNYNSDDIMNLINREDKDIQIVIYCYHGNSSRKVASFLSSYGFKKVYSLIGGFESWNNSL